GPARAEGVDHGAADAFALVVGVHVDLGQLEGVPQPGVGRVGAGPVGQRPVDDVVPPLAGGAAEAVGEADDPRTPGCVAPLREVALELGVGPVVAHDRAAAGDLVRGRAHGRGVDVHHR